MVDKSFTIPELITISDVYSKYIGGRMNIKKSDQKATMVNEVSKYFGDKPTIAIVPRNKTIKIPSLANIAKKFSFKPSYPKEVLSAAVAKTYHIEKGSEWEQYSTIPLNYSYKGCNKTCSGYCYPKYTKKGSNLNQDFLILHIC